MPPRVSWKKPIDTILRDVYASSEMPNQTQAEAQAAGAGSPARRGPRHRGVGLVAKRLGCSRTTLWRALTGRTEKAGPRLLARYHDLLALRGATSRAETGSPSTQETPVHS